MGKNEMQESSQRNFLLTATVAAAAGLTLSDAKLFAAPAEGPGTEAAPDSFKLYSAENLAAEWQGLDKTPGNKTIVDTGTFAIILTSEKAKSGSEYELHENKDHILQIVDGTTVYEVGGTLKNSRKIGPGDWRSTEAEGTKKIPLKKGDLFLIPRKTVHRRITTDSVTLMLVSPTGVKA